tara:strand:+ start:545 stop:856 length:312 start_codon:yes stop_codon:yes gene_type:complete
MKVYTFVIGSTDDFEHIGDLDDYVEKNGYTGNLNYSVFEFDCPADCSPEVVSMIGRGYAFSEGWSMDDTYSFLISGALDGIAEKEMFDKGTQMKLDLAQCSDV